MSAAQLVDVVGGGLITTNVQSPIVGDPNPAIQIATAGYLTTGDLSPGDAGEVGGMFDGITVELWFAPGTPSAFTDTFAQGPNTTVGRQWSMQLTTAGKIVWTARDSTGATFSVTSTNPIPTGTTTNWTHIVGVVRAGFVRLYLNGVEAGTAVAWGGPFPATLVAGSADMQLGSSGSHIGFWNFSNLAVWRQGISAARILAHYVAGAQRGFPQQLSGDRVNAVLNASASALATRRVAAGQRQADEAYMAGQPPSQVLTDAVSVDNVDAALFIGADGAVVYLDAAHRSSSPYNTAQATFGDAGGGEIPYMMMSDNLNDSFLFNEWNVTRLGSDLTAGVTQTTSAVPAGGFKRSQSLTGLPLVSDADALTIATAMLAKYKDPLPRIPSMVFITGDPVVTEALFRRELMDRIRVLRTPPGGGARIDRTLFIQKIEVDADPSGLWSVTWGVSPL